MSNTQGILILVCIILIVLLIVYVYNNYYGSYTVFGETSVQTDTKCKRLSSNNKRVPTLINVSSDDKLNRPLHDFNIKTAYNCCALDNSKDGLVDECALKNCLQQGVRCVDFEIYSRNNEPIVATSSKYNMNVKNSLNQVHFKKVLKIINNMAFSTGRVPNYSDPLIIHMRIMSENMEIYDKIVNYINTFIDKEHILGPKYSYTNYGMNLGGIQLRTLTNKIIFIIRENNVYGQTTLAEYINAASQSDKMRFMFIKDIAGYSDENIKTYNQTKMTIVFPDITNNNQNIDSSIPQGLGCQLIGMSHQIDDENLKIYNSYFENSNSAFVVKSPHLLKSSNSISTDADTDYLNFEV